MEYTNCNLCGTDYHKAHFLYSTPERYSYKEKFNLVKCPTCGLVYVNPRPYRDEMKQYYPPDYHQRPLTGQASPEKSTIWGIGWKDAIGKKIEPILKIHPSRGRILDIGAGDGSVIKFMEGLGWEGWGIEPIENCVEYAREKLGLKNFVKCSAEDINSVFKEENFFDVITMFHVLEHLHNPLSVLQKIKSYLKPDGFLIIEVPNFASFEAMIFRSAWVGISAPLHLYHFTPKTLSTLLEKSGYSVKKIEFSTDKALKYVPNYSESLRFMLKDWGILKTIRNATGRNTDSLSYTKDPRQSYLISILKKIEYRIFRIAENLTAIFHIGPYIRIFARKT